MKLFFQRKLRYYIYKGVSALWWISPYFYIREGITYIYEWLGKKLLLQPTFQNWPQLDPNNMQNYYVLIKIVDVVNNFSHKEILDCFLRICQAVLWPRYRPGSHLSPQKIMSHAEVFATIT
jgi:hypothetical protein